MKTFLLSSAVALTAASSAVAEGFPAGYPADYGSMVEAAKEQGEILIYTNLSDKNLGPVVEAFNATYPEIKISTVEMGPSEAFSRYEAEVGTGIKSADLIIANSIPDWVRAADAGLLKDYASPEKANVPAWSVPKPGLFTFSSDPMVTIYNKLTVPNELQVNTMGEYFDNIVAHPDVFEGKVGSYDGRYAFGGSIGYAFARHHGDAAWNWFETAGPMTRPGGGAGGMIERTLTGELASSFFVSGPVVLSKLDSGIGEVIGWNFPADGTPVFLRGMGITAKAEHDAAAKVFLDFVLSEEGQYAVADGKLTAYRPGVKPESETSYSLDEVIEAIGGEENMIFIDYDDDMVKNFEAFNDRWGQAFNM
ncbi:ABC transporter substrate-binding protein [uncultured Shimia sp.]|uniref:ABC transporter substrate-binding protein n=1 Tax=uncultured Shimia sp. TaxID=573152 RepID=UPI00261817E3|nr:ABC transporter substrate-binding protein [uncultured Shimia sp.]